MAFQKVPSLGSIPGLITLVIGFVIAGFIVSKIGFLKGISEGQMPMNLASS